ncbi:MAG: glycosyltransferase family 39 protein [Chloroflexota bacterium]|nr:glycosyltransferase family 39 protein [Chloroflexota bacterium]
MLVRLRTLFNPYAELLVLLIAVVTRFWRLNYHSFWFDEAVSLRWAGADVAFIWQKTFPLLEEKHPPLYYIGLHGWQGLLDPFGLAQSDAALRAFGSLLGVLTVWGIVLLARRVSGRATGLLAGLLVAVSPVLIWYSQELRMFQPATTGIVWASYALLRAWQSRRAWSRLGWWLGFVVAMEAALYSYLFSAFMLPAAGLTLLTLFIVHRFTQIHTDQRRRFGEGLVALGVAGLLFLPLAYNAWIVNSSEGTPGEAFADLGVTLWRLLRIFTIWRVDWDTWLIAVTLALFALLLLSGLCLPFVKSAHLSSAAPDRAWLLIWIATPLLIGNLLLSRDQSVFAEDRYFLFVAPFALWTIARGVIALGQRWRAGGWLTGLVTVILLTTALPRLWTPALYRENWRAAATHISAYQQASPNLSGAVVAHVDYTHDALEWYLRQAFNFAELPVFFPYGGTLTPEQVEDTVAPPLQGIVDTGATTLWLTQSHLEGVDDGRLVEGWLNQNFPLITEQFPSGVKLSGYALQSRFAALPTLSAAAIYPAAELAPGLRLAACEVLTPRLAAQDAQMHPPSGWVHVRLWWQATGSIQDDYIASAQMVGPQGVWGERLYRDNEALRRWPTRDWALGEIVRDEVDINLNPATPAGEYPVLIGVLDSQGQPIGNKIECGRVTISGEFASSGSMETLSV